MKNFTLTATTRLLCALAAGVALSGCATYGPAYPGYATAPAAAAYPVAPYYAYGDPFWDDGYYAYGGPGYVGPGLALDLRFHDHGYYGYRGGPRYYRGHPWGGHPWGGHAWGGPRPGGPHFGGGPRPGGFHGGFHGGHGGFHGGGAGRH